MTEQGLKRRRINGTHHWSDTETIHLVQQVSEEVKDRPEAFEKPTAQGFYKKVSAKSAILKNLDWVPMKNKMRHLKSTYISAVNWKNQTGAGILATGNEESVKYKKLQQTAPKTKNVNPFSLLISLQEKKLEIEVKKFELEKEMATSELEIK